MPSEETARETTKTVVYVRPLCNSEDCVLFFRLFLRLVVSKPSSRNKGESWERETNEETGRAIGVIVSRTKVENEPSPTSPSNQFRKI